MESTDMKSEWLEYSKQVESISKRFGSNLSYLGSGMEGGVWSIDDSYALKLSRIEKKPNSKYIPELEPRVYASGKLNNNVSWVVKELFDKPEDIFEDILSELIIEFAFYVEKTIGKSKWTDIGEFSWIGEKAYNAFLIDSSMKLCTLDGVKKFHGLSDNWILNFAIELSYKFLTKRDLDLHFDNLGIRRGNRNLIFYDW
jgi:hypothetical protein